VSCVCPMGVDTPLLHGIRRAAVGHSAYAKVKAARATAWSGTQ